MPDKPKPPASAEVHYPYQCLRCGADITISNPAKDADTLGLFGCIACLKGALSQKPDTPAEVHYAAALLGRKGGSIKGSQAKREAAKRNAKGRWDRVRADKLKDGA